MEGGGGTEAGDGQQGKAVATVGGGTRDRSGSGSGGPRRVLAARFHPRPPSKVNRIRRSGVGAKISRYLELLDGAVVGGGAAHGWRGRPGGNLCERPAGAGQAGLGADQDAVEKTSNSTTP
ncbi:hypothetical protein ZWY2020_049122 [Hordeum vulgare]|nr:hypothetical protein ZWY2020_049122 [Hordeum vulgare]